MAPSSSSAEPCKGWLNPYAWETMDVEQLAKCVLTSDVNETDSHGLTPLHYAARKNSDPLIISGLIDAGANFAARDQFEWTPLHSATYFNSNPLVLAALINAGADVNAKADFDATALHYAMLARADISIVTTLLNNKADANAKLDDLQYLYRTPLHLAAQFTTDPAIITALINAGASISIKDSKGEIPFDKAKHNNSLTGTDALLLLINTRSD